MLNINNNTRMCGAAFTELFNIPPQKTGILDRLTFAVKDTIDIQGYKTTCCNPMWRDTHFDAVVNAICVEQLLVAGAGCLGKTICGEFGCGLTGVNRFFGTPINPKTPHLVPGGSSGGSASVVAEGLVDFALGTDAGGSIRIPASYCGVYGMRPSHGLISLSGVNHLSSSFDTVGVFAKNPKILSKVMSVLLAQKNNSETSVGTIYVLSDYFELVDDDIKSSLKNAVNLLKAIYPEKIEVIQSGAIDIEANDLVRGWANTFRTIFCGEVWSSLGAWIKHVDLEFGKNTYVDFSRIRELDRKEIGMAMYQREKQFLKLKDFLCTNNLICIPTAPNIAPCGGGESNITNYARFRRLLSISGIGRLPQISLPVCENKGASVGLSLVAAHRQDMNLLNIVNDICDCLPSISSIF